MRVLVLDSALSRRTAAMVTDDVVVAHRTEAVSPTAANSGAGLPAMARDVMEEARGSSTEADQGPDLVAVTVGPGSFTGIRSGLALAHGIGLATNTPVVGVTVGEAMAHAFPHLGDRALWIVTDSRRGHVFLERDNE